MIVEIGIVIGLYILTRLIPVEKPIIYRALSIVTGLVTLAVILDLGYRGVMGNSIVDLVISNHSTDTPKVSKKDVKGASVTVTRADGGSITTNLGYGIAVAKGSTLRREWIAIHDGSSPVVIEETPGITTVYKSEQYGGKYLYRTKFKIKASEPLTAIEVRFLTFDVWGNHVRSLKLAEVTDITSGEVREFEGTWPLYSESDVEAHYASIAYVSRARLKDGKVYSANDQPVIDEARKFSSRFSIEDLEPKEKPIEGKDKKK